MRILLVVALSYLIYHVYFMDFLEEYEPWYQESSEISFYIFAFFYLWSLAQTVCSDPGTPSKDYMPVSEQTGYCGVCNNVVPERYRLSLI